MTKQSAASHGYHTCEIASSTLRWEFQSGFASATDFFNLLKPRVMMLVIFTGWVGMCLAPGHLNPLVALAGIICMATGSGAAGALNMWYDAALDKRMTRTQDRPIPQGRIQPKEALAFGLFLSITSVVLMGLLVSLEAAFLLAFTIFFYAIIYTMILKQRTPQNIVIGGLAGALPPVIGWSCVSSVMVTLEPWILCTMIFLWTPPHFWALALVKVKEYKNAGIPMLPVVFGAKTTKRSIFGYTLLLVGSSYLPYMVHTVSGVGYGIGATLLGGYYVWVNWQLLQTDSPTSKAYQSFGFSILYLFALFTLLLIAQAL